MSFVPGGTNDAHFAVQYHVALKGGMLSAFSALSVRFLFYKTLFFLFRIASRLFGRNGRTCSVGLVRVWKKERTNVFLIRQVLFARFLLFLLLFCLLLCELVFCLAGRCFLLCLLCLQKKNGDFLLF